MIRLLDEVVVTTPTIGSNVEEITYKNIKFLVWDIGGQGTSSTLIATDNVRITSFIVAHLLHKHTCTIQF